MATTRTRKAPVKAQEDIVEDVDVQEEKELSPKQIIGIGIEQVVGATGVDNQKARYKAMRAIAYQAFIEAIGSDDFEALVDRAIANIDDLPTGWTMERAVKAEVEAEEEAPKPSPRKRPAADRRRPARKA